jgi:adenylate cyclase
MKTTTSASELSEETGLPLDRLDWLTHIGLLKPPEPGRFSRGDAIRAKMMKALLDAGFSREQIEWAVSEGNLDLHHVDKYVLVDSGPRYRTFAEFSASTGTNAHLLPALFHVLGLSEPDPSSRIDVLEEALLDQFLRVWQLAGNDEAFIRAARLAGEGTRFAVAGWMDLFLEQVAGPARERFLRQEVEHFPPEVARASTLLARLLPKLMVWLTQRYLEQIIFGGIVDGFEAFLASRGQAPLPQPAAPPAVVFADLSGYTRLTDERGDETAVRLAEALQRRAEDIAADKGGRLVKLLGDGAMLYFPDPRRGVQAALELVRSFTDDLELSVHAGVHAGPVIERDRDLFGRTVNLAARIAGTAGPGEVIVSEATLRAAGNEGLRYEPLDGAMLKGFPQPVQLFRASLAVQE